MKSANACLRCKSDEVVRVPPVPGDVPHIAVGDGPMHSVDVVTYVCTKCGLLEQRVDDPSDLELLRTHYLKERTDASAPE
jgi:hypothetical protein